jgi:hypothetical protein
MRSSHATSDIDAGPANDKARKQTERRGRNSTTERSFGPRSSSLPPCSKLSRRGLETSKCALWPERRPTLTASARAGVRNLRSGRKKACGAVEQKKAQKQRKKGLDSAPAHISPIAPAAPPVPNFPRLRALALFGRRPPQRLERFVVPASKNLHTFGLTYPRGKQHHELTILRTRTFNFCGFHLACVCRRSADLTFCHQCAVCHFPVIFEKWVVALRARNLRT